jgi:hypothetical protein
VRSIAITTALAATVLAAAAGAGQFLFGFPWEQTLNARVSSYSECREPNELVIQLDVFSSARIVRETVSEEESTVTITVRAAKNRGTFDNGTLRRRVFTLRGPLAGRAVIDGASGIAVNAVPFIPSQP